MSQQYLSFNNIGKQFPGVKALDSISFGVSEGSVHALVGENGAGKSTLLKILSGAYTPSAGSMALNGKTTSFTSTADALAQGVSVIYQELHLAPELSVAENIYLGHLPHKNSFVNKHALLGNARMQLAILGEDLDPRVKVGTLPIGQRQMVEIAKALARGAKIIAFDEPTSSLSDREIKKLFAVILDLKNKGHVMLYVSHRMEEIFHICDSVTVLRDGCHVKSYDTLTGLTQDELVKLMVGREISDIYGYTPRAKGKMVLQAENITGPGLAQPTSLNVSAGEIVGIFGLVGAGRSEFLKCLYGATTRTGGSITIDGAVFSGKNPASAIKAGMMLCPEDRRKEGIIPIRPVLENINISARRNNVAAGLFLKENWEQHNAQTQIQAMAIKTPTPQQLIMNLSGGNQQKAILGRWLSEQIRILLLDEPTRGIDVGAKNEIYSLMYKLASQGMGIIMVSSDLPEILGVSDRIITMRQGVFSASYERKDASAEEILASALPTACG